MILFTLHMPVTGRNLLSAGWYYPRVLLVTIGAREFAFSLP